MPIRHNMIQKLDVLLLILLISSLQQVVSQPDDFPEAAGDCQRMRNENVVRIIGKVRQRKDPNPNLPSGFLELAVEDVQILNTVSQKLPFLPGEEGQLSEETRLRNRVLDLRSATHQKSFEIASKLL